MSIRTQVPRTRALRPRARLEWILLLVSAFLVPGSMAIAASAQEANEPTVRSSTPEAAPPAQSPQAQRRANRARVNEGLRIWWNQPRYVSALGLSENQRQQMDSILEKHRGKRAEHMSAMQDARRGVGDAAVIGDFEKADAFRETVAESTAAISRLETGLMVSVVELLTPEQRALVAEKFSGILRRPWLMGGGPGGMGVPWSARQRPGMQRGGNQGSARGGG